WYKEAINNPSEIIMSEPYEDAVNKKIVVTYSKAVKSDNGEIQGVVSLDKNLDSLSDIVRNINFGNNSFATVLSENGTIVAHGDNSLIGKNAKEVPWIEEVQNIENNTSKNIDIDGVEYLSYKTIENGTGLSVVV
ncbi:chemotaxis protein, partial [Clostridium perfringens]|nr:chemotaxis protein [Clostridium perfringens]